MSRLLATLVFFISLSLSAQAYAALAGELDASFNPSDIGFGNGDGANNTVKTTVLQADGKIVIGGSFTSYNSTAANRVGRLNTDGTLDSAFSVGTGANNTVWTLAGQPDNQILVGGQFTSYNGSAINRIMRLNSDGSLDASFNPGSGANAHVLAIGVQPDSRILIGGSFTSFDGIGMSRIARLNSDGSRDITFSVGTGANNDIYAICLQADGKILIGGDFTSYNGTAVNRIARLNSDGTLDATFSIGSGIDGAGYVHVHVMTIQPDGKILAGGQFASYNGNSSNSLVRLNDDGTFDTSFTTGTGIATAVGYSAPIVNTVAVQSDGDLLVGGWFFTYQGVASNGLVRLNNNGLVDTGFNVAIGFNSTVNSLNIQTDHRIVIGGSFGAFNNTGNNDATRLNIDGSLANDFNIGSGASGDQIKTVALQADGKILLGGAFNRYNGMLSNRIARLLPNGSIDATFNIGIGADNSIGRLAVQSDGKIIIGGGFTSYNGTAINRIARLNTDGSLDSTFNVGSGIGGASRWVEPINIQADGKILVAGYFSSYNGTAMSNLARLNTDGSLDATFNIGTGTNDAIYAVATQQDGKILIGGNFTSYNGASVWRLARLNTDGSLDATFNMSSSGPNGAIYAITELPDGKILIGGGFSSYKGTPITGLTRLNSDGSLDTTFNSGTGAYLVTFALQPDGKIIVGGNFTSYNGTPRNRIARVNSDGSLDTTFNVGTGINGTTGPNVWSVAAQTDGKLLLGGQFTSYNTIGRNRIVRISSGDTDNDGVEDAVDFDRDNDGVVDLQDAFPLDPAESVDTDGDGVGNNADNCVAVANASQTDTDSDGAGDICDNTPNGDTDNDGLDNLSDNCVSVSNADQLNADGDGEGNACDADDDNDGVADVSDAFPLDSSESVDTDNDGIGNNADTTPNGDTDNDGIDNLSDNCVSVSNTDQLNTDGDGEGNACDSDDDNDNVADVSDAFPLDATESVDTDSDGVGNNADNCVAVANASQTDTDSDGAGDVCDNTPNGDTDNDGIDNAADNCPLIANVNQLDHDADGTGDACDDAVPLPEDFIGAANSKAGASVAFAGDVNGDGYGDYIIGMPGYDIPASPPLKAIKNAGRAEVISGNDGAVLMSVNGVEANDAMGTAVAGNADINNDGLADVLVGAPLADSDAKDVGSVTVLFGPDGATSHTLYGEQAKAGFGTALALGDLDNDSYAEMIIGAPKTDDENRLADVGAVMVFDHSNTLIQTHTGVAAKDYFGSSVAVGDVNHDGNADVIVGSPNADDGANGLVDAGKVAAFSSVTAEALFTAYGDRANTLFGTSVAAGDVNHDGFDDVLVGSPGDVNGTLKNAGSIAVFSGSTGVRLTKQFGATASAYHGNSVAVGDVNGDGFADIIAGSWKDDTLYAPFINNAGSVFVRSGNGYRLLGMLYGNAANDYFGAAVSAGDINSDGKADVIIGVPGFTKGAGAVRVLSGDAL